jgi:hypothetical protein
MRIKNLKPLNSAQEEMIILTFLDADDNGAFYRVSDIASLSLLSLSHVVTQCCSVSPSLSCPIPHSLLPLHLFILLHPPLPYSHCHVVTHCRMKHSLSCPLHHSLLTPHLFIPTHSPLPPLPVML